MTCDEVRDLAPLYAAGALDAAEEAAVREHMLTCPLAHDEIAEFGAAAQALLETVEPAEPSAGLRNRILAAAAADLAEGRHPAAARVPAEPDAAAVATISTGAAPVETALAAVTAVAADASPAPVQRSAPAPIVLASRRQTNLFRAAFALAAVVIVALAGLGLSLQRDLQAAQAYRDGVNSVLTLAAQPGSQAALLAADDGSVSGLGVIGADGTVKIAMRGLPATTGSEVYTAWAISGSGAPVAIGDFTVGNDGTAVATVHAPSPAPGVVLALTLEPHGGGTTPTGPVVAKGVAHSTSG
jgi:hypothetical protein